MSKNAKIQLTITFDYDNLLDYQNGRIYNFTHDLFVGNNDFEQEVAGILIGLLQGTTEVLLEKVEELQKNRKELITIKDLIEIDGLLRRLKTY